MKICHLVRGDRETPYDQSVVGGVLMNQKTIKMRDGEREGRDT